MKRCWPQHETQNTILPEQSEYTQPRLVGTELSRATSGYPRIKSDNTRTVNPATTHLRISIPRELGRSV